MKYHENIPLVPLLHGKAVNVEIEEHNYIVNLEWWGSSGGKWHAFRPGVSMQHSLATDDNPGTTAFKAAEVLHAERMKKLDKAPLLSDVKSRLHTMNHEVAKLIKDIERLQQ